MDEPAPCRERPPRAFHFGAAVLVGVGFLPWLVHLAILLWIAPHFEEIFAQLDTEPPAATQALLAASGFFRTWGCVMLPLLGCLVVGLMVLAAVSAGRSDGWTRAVAALSLVAFVLGGLVVFALFLPLIQLIHVMGQ